MASQEVDDARLNTCRANEVAQRKVSDYSREAGASSERTAAAQRLLAADFQELDCPSVIAKAQNQLECAKELGHGVGGSVPLRSDAAGLFTISLGGSMNTLEKECAPEQPALILPGTDKRVIKF